jgi:hypothetical protein
MATESPNHPQPDEIPENERTGSEPNPTGKSGESKENTPKARARNFCRYREIRSPLRCRARDTRCSPTPSREGPASVTSPSRRQAADRPS